MAKKFDTRSEAEKELWTKLRSRCDKGREAYRGMREDAWLTLAFLSGNQHCKYSRSAGLVSVENEADEIRITDNRMLPAYYRWMGYLFSEKPVITCFQGGQELRDAERARVASSLCDYWETACGWTEARKEAAGWMGMCGVGYTMVSWRKNLAVKKRKTRFEFAPEGIEENLAGGKKRIKFLREKSVEEYEGDISFDSLPSLNVYPFPVNATKWDKVTGVMVVDVAGLDWLKTQEHGRNLVEDELEELGADDFNRSAVENLRAMCSGDFSMRSSLGDEEKAYLVLQWFERPSADQPDGRYVLMIGGKLIADTKLPYVAEAREVDPLDKYNITMGVFPCWPGDFPGRLVPPSPFGELRPAQIRLNDLLTDEAANRKTVGRNKLIVEDNCLADDGWEGRHGEIIRLKPGTDKVKPSFVQGVPLAGIGQEIARAEMSFEEVSGQTDVLRGKNPSNVRAGFHLDILRNESLGLIHTVTDKVEAWYELQARFCLAMARTRYDNERITAIHGLDYAGQALTFKSTVINHDIRVKAGSLRPRNKALIEQKLLELLQIGAFNDKASGRPNFDAFWEMSELGTMNRLVDAEKRHRQRARYENTMMMIYLQVEAPIEHEPHEVHIEEHLAEMARREWYAAPAQVKVLTLAHLNMHRHMLIAQLAPEAMGNPDPVAGIAQPSLSPGGGRGSDGMNLGQAMAGATGPTAQGMLPGGPAPGGGQE